MTKCTICQADFDPNTHTLACPHDVRTEETLKIEPQDETPPVESVSDTPLPGEPFPMDPEVEYVEFVAPKPEFVIPTPGRVVLTAKAKGGKLDPHADHLPAGVIKWHIEDREVELDPWGWESDQRDQVLTISHVSECEDGDLGWDWMTYQKGQAKKLEQVQSIEWMGLRTTPTVEAVSDRFTYHPPKEGQAKVYEQIRAEAYTLAMHLIHCCPPSAELASALDHLDTVVFKANASIARHG